MTDVDAFRDAEYIADVSGISLDDAEPESPTATPPSSTSGPDNGRVRKLQSAAKIAFIDRLLRDLDILIYCELSALYYMDCSIILFAVRAIVELIFFTPKASPFDPTRNQPFIGAIIASNVFCMIFHAFFIRPEAGEATRGYLHGGFFIDFIGQTPVPVLRLLSFDILILLVDFVMLALIVERVKTVGPSNTTPTTTATTSSSTNTDTTQSDGQDHDAEERGVVRNTENADELNSPGADNNTSSSSSPLPAIDNDLHDERSSLLADPSECISARCPRGGHPLDAFSSGQAVILEMGFLSTIRDQWQYTTTPLRPTGYVPSPETATFLRQRFGLQVGTDGRIVRIDR
ncbi:hypothetical protein N7462_002003 [Penicillium macrosclerotiorum]|uniref:uncharacterized protein n=1 Tax=Penicillium macrosclerotiorum TaxID=303699 RepID=UPI0025487C8C|nr:uncharacterized protein N7462_002003 [Penicillium macrosclerotiorum]KAJ5692580.1 hypothetical protein N7462_002003 [Penicillium macrosclerotiorum]